jgi:hypothetical protein
MKTLLSLGLVLAALGSASNAMAWENFVNCNNGALVLDYQVNDAGDAHYQMVVRYSALDYFVKMNAINKNKVNEKQEYVLPVRFSKDSFVGYDGSFSVREGSTYHVYVDHLKKSVFFVAERAGISSPNPFQRVTYSFSNCFTK